MPYSTADYKPEEAARIEECYGKRMNLGRAATPEEVGEMLDSYIRNDTSGYELDKAIATAKEGLPPPVGTKVAAAK